ncbi:MAG: hypothetical protein PHN84_01565 [Desulfuromonadaceae bacterium]|nr:hypothetical protein [Desulfuromonadaceae bacterium]MDD2856668.1 hypothetical protein [Desulfuromonadaceae bacterium]
MPMTIFEALSGNISSFLGGADVLLSVADERPELDGHSIAIPVLADSKELLFSATRRSVPFTRHEEAFCGELMTAFAMLYGGFRQEGYAAQFRTALVASIMDITVARSLRGDHRKGFWPIQQLIQLLKSLSYQKYEGKPATTGVIIHRTTPAELRSVMKMRKHTLIPLKSSQSIDTDFFDNPLTYRFIDGTNLFFLAGIQMQVNGVVRISGTALMNEVERQTQREIFSIIRRSGNGAFAVTVNDASDIEVLTSPARIMVRRKGMWSIFDPDIFRSFLADSIDRDSAEDLIWTLYALSKMRYGTVVMVYKGSGRKLALLKKGAVGGSDPIGRLLIERVQKRSISELKQTGTLLRILSSDGLTIFNSKGRLVDTGFIIDTSHAREIVAGGGRTTAACAASHFGKVIKVSQDGPIELYENGTKIYKFG